MSIPINLNPASFAEASKALSQARQEAEQGRISAFLAREKAHQVAAEQDCLERAYNEKSYAHHRRRASLAKARVEAEAKVREREADYNSLKEIVLKRFREFDVFSDPREGVTGLSDTIPFLLLPLRIETRFKILGLGSDALHQLWVRIYPDDLAVDTFEPVLAEGEITNAQIYWVDMWRASGDTKREHAAWRSLVASHGSGRAAWIQANYHPVNPGEKPVKVAATDVMLIIPTQTPLPAIEIPYVSAYWAAIWLADGDKVSEDAARAALDHDLGKARADEIVNSYRPANLLESPAAPLTRADVTVSVSVIVFPPPGSMPTKRDSWSQPARVHIMPDRLVLLGYVNGNLTLERVGNPIPSPLSVGPDPSVPEGQSVRAEKGEIVLSDELKWMVDFKRAVDDGMGFVIDLTAEQYRKGYDRLMVLGVRLEPNGCGGKTLLEELLSHHQTSRSGLSLLPQGTPTNNTEQLAASFTPLDNPEASFDDYATPGALFTNTPDWMTKRDGQWLAECLGIDPAVLAKTHHSGGRDQLEARAMNVALWPATIGYFMESMMGPVFNNNTIEETRWFFNHFVSGRGMIPAIRIGKQPYGILPTTVFKRLRWPYQDGWGMFESVTHPKGYRGFLRRLYELLLKVEADWDVLRDKVAYVGKSGDPHQTLLDVVGLSPGSVEYYQLYAESIEQLYNSLNLEGLARVLVSGLLALGYKQTGMDLLAHLGYAGAVRPEILDKFFLGDPYKLKGDVVQAGVLSETEQLSACTPGGNNYIAWLAEAARTSLETIRTQHGFTNNQAPTDLLYIMLRHAITLGYWDASLRLHQIAQLLTADAVRQARIEPKFIHIGSDAAAGTGESRWSMLYKTEPAITGQPDMMVADFIPHVINQSSGTHYLHEQLEALDRLNEAPTARLERVFAEHVDCASYRLDAWKLGLVHYRLASLRYAGEAPQPGIYLGMYGWLEKVHPENKVLERVNLEGELANIFAREEDTPLVRDRKNAGFIHAPSLNHAVTAAVLRNGYLANASPGTPGVLSVNLSSERVRGALSVLEGIRNGQNLASLLGYQFERRLHDSHNLAEVDKFIYKLRKAFPLTADHFQTTKTEDDVPVEAIEARNVVDGLALLKHVQKNDEWAYPFGLSLPPASKEERDVIEAEVVRLADFNDAVADLAMAEEVHQVVLGNYDRAAATADAYSKATFPTIPEVVQTPRSGIGITHRVGLHLEPGRALNASPIPGVAMTQRAWAEPALNAWLAAVLPDPTQVSCHVSYIKAATGAAVRSTVTQAQLGLQPVDLLYLLNPDSAQAMTALDDHIVRYLFSQASPPRLDSSISVGYMERGQGLIPFFEVAALIHSLRSLLCRSRPLLPGDLTLQEEARSQADKDLYVDPARLLNPRNDMDQLETDLETLAGNLKLKLADPLVNREAIISGIDGATQAYIGLTHDVAAFGVPQAGIGFAYEWLRMTVESLLGKADGLVNRWQEKLKDLDNMMATYAALPAGTSDDERFALLQQAESLISTQLTVPPPATPAAFELVVAARRAAFLAAKAPFDAILSANPISVFEVLSALRAAQHVDDFDPVALDLSADEDAILRFAEDLESHATSLANELDKHIKAADAEMTVYSTTTDVEKQAAALVKEAKALFGEDFLLIPEFTLPAGVADELEKALADTPGLLDYLIDDAGVDFPVDEWLYGVARVREKMHHWENITFLAEAFGAVTPVLQPAQLPFETDTSWLALPFPEDFQIKGEHLLYTAHYSVPFDKTTRQCGLLLDEWNEVIPSQDETTGLTFHYDRPSSEPPQTMLLVVPPEITGHWRWADLVDALHETLDMAVLRAIEPDQVEQLPYARFLPATLMAVTANPITIIANLAWNNLVFEALKGIDHE